MWLCLNDSFLSIVSKECSRDELLVRARRPGDIERIFPDAKVIETTNTDYQFRARIKKVFVEAALVEEVKRISYGNFKDSVSDTPLHNAYLRVWTAMSSLQPKPPYSDNRFGATFDFEDFPTAPVKKKPAQRTRRGR